MYAFYHVHFKGKSVSSLTATHLTFWDTQIIKVAMALTCFLPPSSPHLSNFPDGDEFPGKIDYFRESGTEASLYRT